MDRGAWWATVRGDAKSDTTERLSRAHSTPTLQVVSLPPEPPGEPHTQQSCLPPTEKLKQTVCLNTQLFDSVHIQNFLVPHFQIHQKIKATCPSWPRDPKSLLRKGKVSVLPNLLSTYHTRAPTYLSGIIYVVNHFLDLIRREQ